MTNPSPFDQLRVLLNQVGVRTTDDRLVDGTVGFPFAFVLSDGSRVVLDLPAPGILESFDPDELGMALVDPLGYVRLTWGLGQRVGHFRGKGSLLEGTLGGLLQAAFQGVSGNLYLDGYRFFTSASVSGGAGGPVTEVLILVSNANEERQIRRQAGRAGRMANALKRLGKALTMNQTMGPLCVAAAHEIASTAELASVLIWTHDVEAQSLVLAASVGANRIGISVLNRLSVAGTSCVAEMVAGTRQPLTVGTVTDHVLTQNLEAKFCYLKPGSLSVHPLVISDRLLGVVELIGREGDPAFEENGELFQTIAEHLALAMNSAQMFEDFERLASHDPLTGLANHRALHEFLQVRLTEAQRLNQEMSVLMMDVDHFRSFNEEEGHDAGDDVLRLVAEGIRTCLRPYDLAGRYGGEEFTALLPNAGPREAMVIAERIRAKVESIPYVTRSGRERHVTISIGMATYPATGSQAAALVKAADMALFEAKRSGRNRAVLFEGAFSSPAESITPKFDGLASIVPIDDAAEGEQRERRLDGVLRDLAISLCLSEAQDAILRALVRFAPVYQAAVAEGNEEFLSDFAKLEEYRLLSPSLMVLEERFDGAGPQRTAGAKIPLLARVLQAVLALDATRGRAFLEDSGRFDPEIVSILSDLPGRDLPRVA